MRDLGRCMELRDWEIYVWPVVGRPESSSSLSSCVCCFKTFAFSWLRRQLSSSLKIFVDKRLEMIPYLAFLLSFYVYFIIFPQGFCGGRDDGCVVQEQGRTGDLPSTSQQYFLSHSHLQYLWQLSVFQKAEKRLKYILRESLLWYSFLYPLCYATHILKTVNKSILTIQALYYSKQPFF